MAEQARRARIEDVHELAMNMPHVSVAYGGHGNPVFWVESKADKLARIQDERSPFFTTSHFDGHLSVLIRGSRISELSLQELTEVVQDAWLCRASARRAATWLSAYGGERAQS